MTTPYKLYGVEMSLYTGKIRPYLRWKQIPFEEIRSGAEALRGGHHAPRGLARHSRDRHARR